jgi:hypothetical protein
MRPLARESACADREPDAPESWNEGLSGRAGVRGGRPAAKRARRSVRSLISAIVILNTRSEDGQRQTPPDSLCSRHPTSPSARPLSGHPSRRHQRWPVPSALLRGVAPYRRPAPWCLEPVAADVPDARIRQHRNTYRQRFFLTGRGGGLQGGLRRHARQNSLCSRSVRTTWRFRPIRTTFHSGTVKYRLTTPT